MLGLGDIYIFSAVTGCILISAVGVIYGAVNWNADGDDK